MTPRARGLCRDGFTGRSQHPTRCLLADHDRRRADVARGHRRRDRGIGDAKRPAAIAGVPLPSAMKAVAREAAREAEASAAGASAWNPAVVRAALHWVA